MGLTKRDLFSDYHNDVAQYAKVFGHPARVAIIQYLFTLDGCVCGDIVNEIGLAQPTISQHLKELRSLGLIKGTVEGTSICYCIDRENWKKMKQVLSGFLGQDLSPYLCCE